MTQYSRLSIWENSHGMSWYDYAIGRKSPAEPFITPNTEYRTKADDQASWPRDIGCTDLSYQDAWFNELKAQDRKKKASRTRKEPTTSELINAALVGFNTKLLQPDPYFEYMFADAELNNCSGSPGNSIDDLSVGKQSNEDESMQDVDHQFIYPPSLSKNQPVTPRIDSIEPKLFDTSASLGQKRQQLSDTASGIKHDKFEFPENLNTPGLSGSFYSLKLKHNKTADVVNNGSVGRGRDGLKKEEQILYQNSTKVGQVQERQKLVLKPISRRVVQERKVKANGNHKVPIAYNPRILAPLKLEVKVSKKRSAEESHTYELSGHNDENGKISNKKARFVVDEPQTIDPELLRITSIAAESILSDAASSRQASGDFFSHKPLAIAPKGYAGQFEGMVIKSNLMADHKYNLTDLDKIKSHVHHTFGDRRHPNGIFTHTSITFDPLCKAPDFTREDLPSSHALLTCMDFATNMTIQAAGTEIVELRNGDEEILRREAHIECARARLEGVTVGYYRYYQGHLSVEEYHDAEMCIC